MGYSEMKIKKVLLVEDNPLDADLINLAINKTKTNEFQIHTANCLNGVRKALENGQFSLILSDLNLPDSIGLETLSQLLLLTPILPIVVLTCLEDETTAIKAVQTGAQDYLIKGQADGQAILRSMRYAIERKNLELALRRRESILEVVGIAANNFLQTTDFDGSIQSLLMRLGEVTNTNRIHICQVDQSPDGDYISKVLFSTVMADSSTEMNIHNQDSFSLTKAGLNRWVRSFHKKHVITGIVTDFPPRERAFFEKSGTKSILMAPILVNDSLWGYFSFQDYVSPRVWLSSEIEAIETASGIIGAVIMRKQAEEKLEYLATHDPLTRLPNRRLFLDRLNHAITRAERNQHRVFVMMIDMDRFKRINDTLGHTAGDEVLKSVSDRLISSVRKSDTVARYGGDEFILILEEVVKEEDIHLISKKILASLSQPYFVGDNVVHSSASIGISSYPQDSSEIDPIIKYADAAMYLAKNPGNQYKIYSQS